MKLFVILLLGCILGFTKATLVNEEVTRVIDLKSHLVRVITKVTLKNTGEKSLSRFQFVLDPKHSGDLASILFTQGSDNDKVLTSVKNADGSYTVKLTKTLSSDSSTSYSVEEVYFGSLTPFPKEITQSQNQLVVYEGNVFFYTPYLSLSQSTKVELSSSTVESYTKFGGAEKSDTEINYADSDEFDNVAANSQKAMKIHYENNSPFIVVTSLERVIEVSHWGNIAVEETLDILHKGSKLKGSFSRYDYQRQPNSGPSAVKSFNTILPASAEDVYYRDEIGNISTSNLLANEDSVDLEIRPRFPLFGSWKTHYYIGYNLPSYNYLYSKGEAHALKMRLVDHVMENQLVEDFTLKLILPEGCKNIEVSLPFEGLTRDSDDLHYTYLDTAGRPVLTFHGKNLVDQHIEDFTVSYTFNRLMLLQEPLLVVAAFFILFLTVIIAVRLDFSIATDSVLEARMRIQGIMEKVQAQQAKREGCYKAYQAAITSYKASKNQSNLNSTRKTIEKSHKDATTVIVDLIEQIKVDSSDSADKVSQLNKLDAELKEKISAAIVLAERLISEKLSRDSYADQDKKVQMAIAELTSKIEELSDSL